MFADGPEDTRAMRRDATRARILDAAWDLARRDGLAAITLREVARQVGMRAPSLYTYFPSKNAMYDAMYTEAARQLAGTLAGRPQADDPRETLRGRMRLFIAFCVTDPARYQLVFERPVPGFERRRSPSRSRPPPWPAPAPTCRPRAWPGSQPWTCSGR